ncbi:hypothetical protein Emed_000282 [Eimeria media]
MPARARVLPRCKSPVLVGASSFPAGPACSLNVTVPVGREATRRVLSCLPSAACCPHIGVSFTPSLRGWGRGLHLLANLAQPKARTDGDAPEGAAGPDPRAASSASVAASAAPEDESSSSSVSAAEALSATEPAEGSYAKELLQHISELVDQMINLPAASASLLTFSASLRLTTAVGADGKEAAGSVAASSEWLVDWLVAFKLGLGVSWRTPASVAYLLDEAVAITYLVPHLKEKPGRNDIRAGLGRLYCWGWLLLTTVKACVALPAAGCLLRLVTLPIAVDSERDRRQRQLVDPQFSRYKEEMKIAYETGNTQEYQRLRVEAKAFLKKHGIGVLPTSLVQMLLLGLAISLCTPAISRSGSISSSSPSSAADNYWRMHCLGLSGAEWEASAACILLFCVRAMARDPSSWKDFAFEQPAWLQSLALPDSSGLSAALCWLVIVSTMAAGWMVSAKIRRQSPSSSLPDNLALPGISSPFVLRGVSLGAATLFAFYSGTQLPAAALLFLVPALGVQSLFMRLFRLRPVERSLHFVPEGLRPLRQTYLNLMERREPALVATWKQRVAQGSKGGNPSFSEAAAGDAAAVSRSLVELWRATEQKRGAGGASHQTLKTWADVVANKQRERMSLAATSQQRAGLRRSS